jgi:sortase (surface protein transpeptidase)
MPNLEAELQAARQRVRDLQAAVTGSEFKQMSGAHVRSRIASHRLTHPILFADLDALEA